MGTPERIKYFRTFSPRPALTPYFQLRQWFLCFCFITREVGALLHFLPSERVFAFEMSRQFGIGLPFTRLIIIVLMLIYRYDIYNSMIVRGCWLEYSPFCRLRVNLLTAILESKGRYLRGYLPDFLQNTIQRSVSRFVKCLAHNFRLHWLVCNLRLRPLCHIRAKIGKDW